MVTTVRNGISDPLGIFSLELSEKIAYMMGNYVMQFCSMMVGFVWAAGTDIVRCSRFLPIYWKG